jgi:hypothetical protein
MARPPKIDDYIVRRRIADLFEIKTDESERRHAKYVADLISKARDLQRRADVHKEDSAKQRALLDSAAHYNTPIGAVITRSENPGRFLRILADAVDGKPLWSKRDIAINKAVAKAMGFDEGGATHIATIFEIDNKLAVVLTQLGINKKPTKKTKHDRDALRRRLNARGIPYSADKPGRKKLPRAKITRNRGKGRDVKAATLNDAKRPRKH